MVNRTPVPGDLKAKYAAEGGSQIEVDVAAMEKLGVKVILGDYLETAQGVARHATERVTRDLLQLASLAAAASGG
jgi:hypothetical protein